MSWIQTYTNRVFTPLDPDPESIDIRDIAHSLSLLCRFNGHCQSYYSVAEHSVRVSRVVPSPLALAGLLHDAAEAYVSDLPRPIKQQIPRFDQIEMVLLAMIFERFGLAWPMAPEVKQADDVLLATEMRDLMGPSPRTWRVDAQPLANSINPLGPEDAEAAFLARFEDLTR